MALGIPTGIRGSEDSKHFIKLKDGESIICVLRGDVFVFRQHWKDRKPTRCTGKETCPDCKAGQKASFRFHVNAIVKEGNSYVVKIWEQGWTVFENIETFNKEMDLELTPLKIVRKGEDMNNTSYTLVPMAKINEEQNKAFSTYKLFDLPNLEKELEGLREPKTETQEFTQDDDIEF